MYAFTNPPWYVLLPDGFMLVAIIGLWVHWVRNSKQQFYLQDMLADTSRQLREASVHLKEAMWAIHELKRKKETAELDDTFGRTAPSQNMVHSTSGNATATQVLRMQREGHDVEKIARQLNTPPAQVRLLLKLHAGGTTS